MAKGKRRTGVKIIIGVVVVLLTAIFTYGILLGCYYPRYASSKKEFDVSATETGNTVTVMSYNVRCFSYNDDLFRKSWFYRADLVLENIEEEAPDIIGFQEINPVHEKYFKKRLKGYSFYVAYRDNTVFKEGLMIAYRADRFASKKTGMYWLSETPEIMSKGWDAAMNRICVYADLQEKSTGKTISFYDTHLDHVGKEARVKGMLLMSEKIKETAPDCAFVVGDMNDFEGSPVYENALASGLVDSLKVAETAYEGKGFTYQGYGKSTDARRIDFCFLSPVITVQEYRVKETTYSGVYPSDHYPLVIRTLL